MKLIRCVFELSLAPNGNITYKQKMSLVYFLMFGIFSYLFIMKKNRVLPNKDEIVSIAYSSAAMTGNRIDIKTATQHYRLEATNKAQWNAIVDYLKNSALQDKLTEK